MATRLRFLRSLPLILALLPAVAFAAGVPPDKATKEQTQAAQRTYKAADDLFDAKRFDEAITAFRASWDIVASPNSRLMIARCLRELGRLDEAHAELVATVDDAKTDEKYADARKAAEDELKQMKSKIALVDVKFTGGAPAGKVMVGAKPYDAAALGKPIVVSPGALTIVTTTDDGREVRKEAKVEAGTTSTIEIDLTAKAGAEPTAPVKTAPSPAPAEEGPAPKASGSSDLRLYAYVAGGVGAAGLVAFTVFGLMNNSKFSSLDSDCADGHCDPDRQSDIDAGKRYQTFANIGLVVGVLGIGSGVTLYLLSGDSGEKKSAKRTSPSPALRVGPGSLVVQGQF